MTKSTQNLVAKRLIKRVNNQGLPNVKKVMTKLIYFKKQETP